MSNIHEINLGAFDSTRPYYYIVNERRVLYKANDVDTLIRGFCNHSQTKATRMGQFGITTNEQEQSTT